MRRVILIFILIIIPVILTTNNGCSTSGNSCPPFIKWKRWKLIDVMVNGKNIYDNIKAQLGGELIVEFRKVKSECKVHAYVKETGKLLYYSKENEPTVEAHSCRGQKGWHISYPIDSSLAPSLPVLGSSYIGFAVIGNYYKFRKNRNYDTLILSKATHSVHTCELRGGGEMIVLKKY